MLKEIFCVFANENVLGGRQASMKWILKLLHLFWLLLLFISLLLFILLVIDLFVYWIDDPWYVAAVIFNLSLF